MKNYKCGLLLFLLILSTFYCASTGKNFDLNKIDQIEIKKTNQNDILNLFGLPMSAKKVIKNGNKFEFWTYSYTDAIGFNKTLIFKFNEEGIVLRFGHSEHELD